MSYKATCPSCTYANLQDTPFTQAKIECRSCGFEFASELPSTAILYLLIKNQQQGPYVFAQVLGMWNSGAITADTLYWQEGMSDWEQVSRLIHKQETAYPSSPSLSEVATIDESEAEWAEADFQNMLQERLKKGWIVVSDGKSGVQLKYPKTMGCLSKGAIMLGFLFWLFAGFLAISLPLVVAGVVFLVGTGFMIAGYIDYATAKERLEFLER